MQMRQSCMVVLPCLDGTLLRGWQTMQLLVPLVR